ncbi:hypothetical protein [Hyphomonas sp.]|uniref:hypothetical protein n=1 Tax=Hyphomonas sp. TaxID=87 RepID=UPI00333F6F88
MRLRLVPALMMLALAGCGKPASEKAAQPDPAAEQAEAADTGERSLEMIWMASGFEQPEGAALAPDGGYFISNIGPGDPADLDGNGHISKLNADGSVAAAKFAEGLDAPAGLAVHEGVLYAADRDGVAMFDASTGAPGGKVLIEGAGFLNDMTVWKGDVLVSDSGTATIHKITPEGASVFATNAAWDGINGILGDGDRLLIATMTEGKLIGLDSASAETLIAAGMKDADGIGLIPGGGYLVSSWPGEIHHVSPGGVVSLLMDTKADGILQNDLSVFGDVVIVPNWEPGTVTAWKITNP